MDKTKAVIEISETASHYRPWWDEVFDKIAYGLIWLGSILWVFYLANGGDIIHCFPVLTCPSPNDVGYNKSSVRSECDKYRSMIGHQGNQSVSIMASFPSLSHYASTNIYCSKKLQGQLYLTGLLLVVTGGYLLFVFRQWYLDPRVESQINGFHDLVTSCAKLPKWKKISEVIDAWKEISSNEETFKPITDKRFKMVDIVSKFSEEEIDQMQIVHAQMRKWKDNLVPGIQLFYSLAQLVNLVFVILFSGVVVKTGLSWYPLLRQEHVCTTELKYDAAYNEIKCSFSGSFLINFVCSIASVILIYISFLSVFICMYMFWIGRSFKDHYLKFYRLLCWRDHNSCAKQLALFDNLNESCIKQIVTDFKCSLQTLGCKIGNALGVLTYVVEDAMVPLPSCLFSETVNNQTWCLKLHNMTEFQSADFIDLEWLSGLKELHISSCCNISCELKAQWIRKLQITSCTMQNELVISDHEQEEPLQSHHQNCWKFHNLEYLSICDPRPFNHLLLDFYNLSELLISNAAINTYLDDLPDVKILTLKFCRLDEGVVIRKTSQRLLSLTLVGCGMTEFPILNCQNLHSLDLTGNCIRFVKECDDIGERGGREEGSENGRGSEKGRERMEQLQRVERGDILEKAHQNERQGLNYPFQPLPKLQKLVLNGNQIISLDYDFLECLKLQKGLTIFDADNNPLQREKMLSDISILYLFTNGMSASHILDLEKYGPYLIEEEESEFPSFLEDLNACMQLNTSVGNTRLPQLSNVSLLDGRHDGTYVAKPNWIQFPPPSKLHIQKKQAVLYCDIRDTKTRRRMMVYMSCIAQLIYRREGFHVCDAFDIPFDAATDIAELHIYLALRQGCVESNINKLQRIVKLAGDKGASVVIMCELEYGDPSSTQKTEETLDSLFACGGRVVRNILTEHPLFKTSSLFRQMAIKLKRGRSLHETIDDLSKTYIF